jgi:hypothetical protein
MKIVVSEKSFSKKQIKKHRIKKYSVFIIVFVAAIILLYFSSQSISKDPNRFNPITLLIVISAIMGALLWILFRWLFKKLDTYIDNIDVNLGIAMAGDDGEVKVFEELKKVLNDSYTVYPNYIIPGHKFDLDFLIVGPKGLIVVEVKNFSNATFFSEDKAMIIKQSDSAYKQETTKLVGSSDPRNKIETHCKTLSNYLSYLEFNNINVKKVLVFAKDHVTIEGKSNIYIVKKIYELGKYFESLYPDDRFTLDGMTPFLRTRLST